MHIRHNPNSGWPQLGRPFHHGVAETPGKVLHFTGQVAWDADLNVIGAGDCETQTHKCFDNVESILADFGGAMGNIVSLTIFYTDPADLPAIQRVRAERIKLEQGPVSILIQAAGLILPEFLVEVIPIAVIPEERFRNPNLISEVKNAE